MSVREKIREILKQRGVYEIIPPGPNLMRAELVDALASLMLEEINEEALYKFLRSINGCNTDYVDSDWADNVNVKELAKKLHDKFGVRKVVLLGKKNKDNALLRDAHSQGWNAYEDEMIRRYPHLTEGEKS